MFNAGCTRFHSPSSGERRSLSRHVFLRLFFMGLLCLPLCSHHRSQQHNRGQRPGAGCARLPTDPCQGALSGAGPTGPAQPGDSIHQRLHLSGSKRNWFWKYSFSELANLFHQLLFFSSWPCHVAHGLLVLRPRIEPGPQGWTGS